MEPRTTLPLDIILYIIDILAGGDSDEDIKSLQTLSLACKSMVPLCRKHLFSSLRLISYERFSGLLSKNSDIACYVRSLSYVVWNPISDHELFILDTLKKCSSLQSIAISSARLNWNDFPESIRSSLISLIELPTVTHLIIHTFKQFPATALSGCSNLEYLELGYINIVSPEVDQVIPRNKILTPVSLYIKRETYGLLKSASLHAGDPIIDLGRIQKAIFDVESRGDINRVFELIMVTTRLESLKVTTCISVNQPLEFAGLGASLAINVYRTLKILEIGVTVVGNDYDPLCGLNHELRFIAGNNILEKLELDVVIQSDVSCRTDSEDWPAFDSVLTESGAFPLLHQVSVEIWWYSVFRTLDDQKHVLESLKEDKFPRLVESKVVEFSFCAELHDSDW